MSADFSHLFLIGGHLGSRLAHVDEQLRRLRRADRRTRGTTRQRLDDLERGLGRVALLARALAELCLEKRILTLDELTRMLEQADLADGVRDGRLEADVALPGEHKLAPLQAPPARKRASKGTRKKTGKTTRKTTGKATPKTTRKDRGSRP